MLFHTDPNPRVDETAEDAALEDALASLPGDPCEDDEDEGDDE